jgi:exo-beta-1,3-glucanase (GH17 family)
VRSLEALSISFKSRLSSSSSAVTVFLGVYIGNNATVNEDQKATTLSVLETYGTDYVDGVTVGNE